MTTAHDGGSHGAEVRRKRAVGAEVERAGGFPDALRGHPAERDDRSAGGRWLAAAIEEGRFAGVVIGDAFDDRSAVTGQRGDAGIAGADIGDGTAGIGMGVRPAAGMRVVEAAVAGGDADLDAAGTNEGEIGIEDAGAAGIGEFLDAGGAVVNEGVGLRWQAGIASNREAGTAAEGIVGDAASRSAEGGAIAGDEAAFGIVGVPLGDRISRGGDEITGFIPDQVAAGPSGILAHLLVAGWDLAVLVE
jgi:hypothetical protein